MNRARPGLFAKWLVHVAGEPKTGRHAVLAVALASAALLATSRGSAGDVRVLLVGPSASHATVVRVRQELALLGIDVEVVSDGASSDLAALARAHGAAAVARVEDAPPEIRLWVDAAHSAGVAQESRVSESLSGRAEPGLLALRAVELLRGRLVPVIAAQDGGLSAPPSAIPSALPSSAPAASASAAPAPSVTGSAASGPAQRETPPNAALPARPVRFTGHLGPAFGGSPGGVTPAVSLRLGGGWRALPPLELDLVALIPLSAGGVSAVEGSIDLRVFMLGAGANVFFTSPSSPLALHAGVGASAAAFFFEGRAVSPWISASGSRWSAVPFLEVGAGYRLTSLLSLRVDLLAGIARPEPVLVLAGRQAASFGTPLLLGSIALEAHP